MRYWQAEYTGDTVTMLDLLTYACKYANPDSLSDVELAVGDISDPALVERLLAERRSTG